MEMDTEPTFLVDEPTVGRFNLKLIYLIYQINTSVNRLNLPNRPLSGYI